MLGKDRSDSSGKSETEEKDERTSEETEEEQSSQQDTGEEEESQSEEDSKEESEEEEEEFDEERARRTIKHLRGIEKDLKSQLKELKPFKAKAEKAEKDRQRKEREAMSATERLETERDEAQSELKEARSENGRLLKQLQRMRFLEQTGWDTKTARRAWNSLGDIDAEPKFDKEGKTTNMQAIKRALAQYDGELFGSGKVDGGKRDESEQEPSDINSRIRAMAR